MATVRVKLLDDTSRSYNVKPKSIASVLIQDIMKDLDVLESDYFGILYNHEGEKTFLDPLKPLNKQIHSFNKELQFVVKFFPPDPGQLQEEYTRYLFALQMKRDLLAGLMTCGENTSLVMASLIVQEDFGEWNSAECSDIEYLKDIKILPSPTPGQLCAVLDLHKKLVNSSYSDTDYKLLDVARRLEHYGIRMHPARDHENTDINLAVNHAGLLVFQGMTKMNNFNWSRIRKLSFKRKRFLIKLRTESQKQNNEVGDILVFVMKSRNACKNFWRICIEYHAFFRLDQRPNPPPKPVLLSRGSSFRYRGKTQKELITLVRESNFRRTEFVRSKSSRRPPRPNHNEATPVRRHSNSFVPSPVAPLTVDIPPSSPPPDYSSHLVQSSVSQPREHAVSSSQISPVKHHEQSPVKVELERPEWREESKSLHSSATPIPTVDDNQSAAVEDDKQEEEWEPKEDLVKKYELHSGGQQVAATKSYEYEAASPQRSPPLPQKVEIVQPPTKINTNELKPSEMRYLSNQAYYIIKELLTTERNYLKDLEVIDKWFKLALEKLSHESDTPYILPENVANQLFGTTDSLLKVHLQFKQELEARTMHWENLGNPALQLDVDDTLLSHMRLMKKLQHLVESSEELVRGIEDACDKSDKFDAACREFDLQKVCYLSVTRFLLTPLQRVVHYYIILSALYKQYSNEQVESEHPLLKQALDISQDLATHVQPMLKNAFNYQMITQLKHDLIGVQSLLTSGREFVREGSLYKLSRKGFQQRMFFLFSDCLLYTSKGVTATNQFKVHGELPLHGMIIEVNESEHAVPNCFTINSGSKNVVVAASTQEEMFKWLEDLNACISDCERTDGTYASPITHSDEKEINHTMDQSDDSSSSRTSLDRSSTQQRSNTTMHVCWHRNTSVSANDYLVSLQNQLCGYLLRKFKNSNGWQKLWVVFTNFCLFFYKSHSDDFPLASLPLLGYSASRPSSNDNINKDYVFKLQFKTHIYFFRAESNYTFNRWLEVIHSATTTSNRVRLFSRMDSAQTA